MGTKGVLFERGMVELRVEVRIRQLYIVVTEERGQRTVKTEVGNINVLC